MDKVSPHVSYKEVTYSELAKRKGLNNEPDAEQLERIKILCEKVFEPTRNFFNTPLYISSFFRTPKLNKLLGGAKNSQHMANNGAALDVDCDTFIYGKITNRQVFDYIKDNLEFDQLILENVSDNGTGGWVHVSYNEGNNRKQVLTMVIKNG